MMIPDKQIINGICQRIDRDLGDGTTAAKLKNFETVILSETLKQKPRNARSTRTAPWIRYTAAAAALVLASVIMYLTFATQDTPLELMVDNRPIHSLSQTALHTGKGDTRLIQFANRSSIKIMANTDAVVKTATENEVVVDLDTGELFLDVEGKESAHWIVNLGKYRVSVLGTQFYVKWQKRGELVDVRVLKGTVLVEGPHTGKVGIAVQRDTHLRLDTLTGFAAMNNVFSPFYDASSPSLLRSESELRTAWDIRMGIHSPGLNSSANAAHRAEAVSKALLDNGAESGRDSGADARNGVANPDSNISKHHHSAGYKSVGEDGTRAQNADKYGRGMAVGNWHDKKDDDDISGNNWAELLAAGDNQGAIAVAEANGFTRVIEQATLTQLWQLMNAARKSGREELAEKILLTCRRRFATSRKARLAAFVLGKVYYYGNNDAATAARWFEVYLNEAPSGPLAEEAMGRLIAIQSERGKINDAASLAQKYLELYPTGAFSRTCHELIEK